MRQRVRFRQPSGSADPMGREIIALADPRELASAARFRTRLLIDGLGAVRIVSVDPNAEDGPIALVEPWPLDRSSLQPSPPETAPTPRPATAPKYPFVVFWSDQDDCWIADVPDLPTSAAIGKTAEEALRDGLTVLAVMVDDADQAGDPLPDPTFGPNAVRAAWALQPGDEDGDAVPTTGLPRYPVIIFWSDEDGCWIADVPDLPGISALGNSPEDAMAALGPAIEQSLELRHPLPNPSPGAAIVAAIRAIRSTGCTG